MGEKNVEFVLNELAAEQAALRLTLQSFLLRLFASRPDATPEALEEMRRHVLRSVNAMPVDAGDPDGGRRWKRLVAARADEIFDEIDEAVDWRVTDVAGRG